MRALCVLICLLLPVLTWSESLFDLPWEGNAAAVQAAIDAGSNPDIRLEEVLSWMERYRLDEQGFTPLTFAIFNDRIEMAQLLLDAGANLEARDNFGRTALDTAIHWSTSRENIEAVQLLLDAGADPQTTLVKAIQNDKSPPVVQALIDAGADLEARTGDGPTPLMLAVSSNNIEMVQLLLHAGADIYARDYADRGSPMNIFPNVIGKDGMGRWDEKNCIWRTDNDPTCNPEVAKLLISHLKDGPNLFELIPRINGTAYGDRFYLEAAGRELTPESTRAALYGGADVHTEGLLHFVVAKNEDPEVIQILLEAGADLEKRNGVDWTPLMTASRQNPNVEVIRTLMRAGANRDAYSRTPFGWWMGHSAVTMSLYNSNPEIVQLFLDAGDDVNEPSGFSEHSLLHLAAQSGTVEVVATLLAAGANLEATNADGDTPLLSVVASGGRIDLIEKLRLLLEAGADPSVFLSNAPGWCIDQYGGNHGCRTVFDFASHKIELSREPDLYNLLLEGHRKAMERIGN